jgi:CHAT domain-containing protein
MLLQERLGGASNAHDLRPIFQPGAQRDILANTDSLNQAITVFKAFQEPNSDRRFIVLFMAELQFQMYLAYAQANFEQALEMFDSAAPGIEKTMASGKTAYSKELAAVLIVMAVHLGQNTRAIGYYDTYKELISQIEEPEFKTKPYEALLHAYTVTGDKAMAEAMQAELAALLEQANEGAMESRMADTMKKSAGGDEEIYFYEQMEETNKGFEVSEPPPEIMTTATISNITNVQLEELSNSLWGIPDYLHMAVQSFEGNVAVLQIITSGSDAGTIAEFLNAQEYPGFVIQAQSDDNTTITARALGVAKEQFNILVPTFDYVANPQEPLDAAPALLFIQTLRTALAQDAREDDFRDVLLNLGAAVLQQASGNTSYFDADSQASNLALEAFPEFAVLVHGAYGLAKARAGQYARALAYFSRVHEYKDKALAEMVQPVINRAYANEIALGIQIADGPLPGFEQASAAIDQLKSKLDAQGETMKLLVVQANLHYKSGDYEKALALFADAENEAARFTNLDNVAMYAMLGRGNCAIMLRRHADAVQAFSGAAQKARDTGNMLLKGTALSHLARVQLFLGQYADAEKASSDALQITEQFAMTSIEWQALYTLARALEAQGKLEPALAAYEKALNALDKTFTVSPDADADAQDVFRYAVALCAHMDKPELAMQIVERGRAHALKLEFQNSSVSFHSPERQQSAQKLDDYKQQITHIESQIQHQAESPESELSQETVTTLKKSLQETQREYIKYVTDLEHTHPELAALYKIEPVDLVKIRKELPDDMAVISYVIGDNALYIFYVRADRLGYHEVPVDGDTLTTQIKLMRSIISNPRNAAVGDAERMENFRRGAGKLYDILFKPVEPDLKDITSVAILPNGILNFVPFQALVPTDGSADYLVQKYAIFYLDSLAAVGNAVPAATDQNTHLYAFGNADETLPEAEQEVNALQKLFPASSVFLRLKATETQAKNLSEQSGVFHFATHGVLDFKDISQSYITLAPDAGEDGKFTIEEVWGYWWGDSVLVSLSACSTAMGELTVRGKSVNPAGAFLNAGAPSVLASLWNVDDAATSELMRVFYDNLTTMKKADALRAAQRALLQNPDTAHPYYWAPFMLIGDWR